MLANPYLRIAIASAIGTLVTPSIVNKLTIAEMKPSDGVVNQTAYWGVTGATVAFAYVLLTMALGKPAAAP